MSTPVPSVTPEKRWIWLNKQNLWGYGYQRADGLYIIDPGTKRASAPEGLTSVPAHGAATTASAGQ
ncbi:MAG: hypothetical protein NVSMB9_35890 [Isosphaeraceae bacterium]